jgi:hypothetical protein
MIAPSPIPEASPHVSVSDIESCFDELIDGAKKRHGRNSNASNGVTLVTLRIAPQLRIHGKSRVLERNREKRLIALTMTDRPGNLSSRLSNNLIGRCYADTFEEETSRHT